MNWDSVTGGESTYDNCQILQTRVNRFKSDKDSVDPTQLRRYSCDIKFTGMFAGLSCLHLNVKCLFFFIYLELLSWCAWVFDSKPTSKR